MSIIMYGTGGQARVLVELMELAGVGPLAGLVDEDSSRAGEVIGTKRVLGPIGRLGEIIKEHGIDRAVIAVGDNATRNRLGEAAKDAGLKLITLVHPTANVSPSALLGEGTVVMAGAVVGVNVKIGPLGIINTRAVIDHDCTLGTAVHIAPGAILTGLVNVGDGAFIGAGATIVPEIVIGEHSVVGAGSVVIHNVEARSTVAGVPARPIARH